MTCFTHTCQLCVPTIVEVSLKRFFFYTRQPPGWKSRRPQNDVYLAFALYLMQSYIQAVLDIYITDYMMALTLYTPISECIFSKLFSVYFLICWQGKFVLQSRGSSVDYHFLYSHELNVWLRGDIEWRN